MPENDIQHLEQASLFNALRQLLKNRGLTYRDLASLMNVSEPTIKRLFQEQDCKLSRVMEICALLDIEFSELMDISRHSQKIRGSVLPEETERCLAENPDLGAFFMLLISHFDIQQIAQSNELSDSDVYRYLRELEKLNLLEMSTGNQFKLLVERPVRWRLNGPLTETLIKVNRSFIEQAIRQYEPDSYPFFSSSRLLSEESIQYIEEQLQLLYEQYQYRATLDQSFYPADQLLPYKLILTLKSFDISRYFPVRKFEKNSTEPK